MDQTGLPVFIFAQFFYILILKWINPPVTLTQLSSLFHGYGLKRNYVSMDAISPYAKLAVISSEDQLFPDHDGFDFKSIEKAMKHNQKSNRFMEPVRFRNRWPRMFFYGRAGAGSEK